MAIVHVIPAGDLIEHEETGDCPCGPLVEPIPADDGTIGGRVRHYSLDGREHRQPGHNPATCPAC